MRPASSKLKLESANQLESFLEKGAHYDMSKYFGMHFAGTSVKLPNLMVGQT